MLAVFTSAGVEFMVNGWITGKYLVTNVKTKKSVWVKSEKVEAITGKLIGNKK